METTKGNERHCVTLGLGSCSIMEGPADHDVCIYGFKINKYRFFSQKIKTTTNITKMIMSSLLENK